MKLDGGNLKFLLCTLSIETSIEILTTYCKQNSLQHNPLYCKMISAMRKYFVTSCTTILSHCM